jgi:prefoldin subunit 5
MARPSKLKRAIKEMEKEVEAFRMEKYQLDIAITERMRIIEGLKKVDNEKNNKD